MLGREVCVSANARSGWRSPAKKTENGKSTVDWSLYSDVAVEIPLLRAVLRDAHLFRFTNDDPLKAANTQARYDRDSVSSGCKGTGAFALSNKLCRKP